MWCKWWLVWHLKVWNPLEYGWQQKMRLELEMRWQVVLHPEWGCKTNKSPPQLMQFLLLLFLCPLPTLFLLLHGSISIGIGVGLWPSAVGAMYGVRIQEHDASTACGCCCGESVTTSTTSGVDPLSVSSSSLDDHSPGDRIEHWFWCHEC